MTVPLTQRFAPIVMALDELEQAMRQTALEPRSRLYVWMSIEAWAKDEARLTAKEVELAGAWKGTGRGG